VDIAIFIMLELADAGMLGRGRLPGARPRRAAYGFSSWVTALKVPSD